MTAYPSRDDGSVTVLAALLVPCVLLVTALLVDGADHLRLLARADAVAAEAARAALTALDTRGPTVRIDPDHAVTAARTYLAARHHTGEIALPAPDIVEVTVHHTEPTALGLFGPTHTVTGHATAQLELGASAVLP